METEGETDGVGGMSKKCEKPQWGSDREANKRAVGSQKLCNMGEWAMPPRMGGEH